MKPIDPAGFEQKFCENIDPWNYTTSPFERYKRGVLLHACGSRAYGRGLELACAIGGTTKSLARLCLRLIAVDSSSTALKEAKQRLSGYSNVTFLQTVLPDETPRGPFDLIVASELAYYLRPYALRELLRKLELALAPGGRIVFLNHSRPIGDAAQSPERAQRTVLLKLQKSMRIVFHERHSRFDVVAFRKFRSGARSDKPVGSADARTKRVQWRRQNRRPKKPPSPASIILDSTRNRGPAAHFSYV